MRYHALGVMCLAVAGISCARMDQDERSNLAEQASALASASAAAPSTPLPSDSVAASRPRDIYHVSYHAPARASAGPPPLPQYTSKDGMDPAVRDAALAQLRKAKEQRAAAHLLQPAPSARVLTPEELKDRDAYVQRQDAYLKAWAAAARELAALPPDVAEQRRAALKEQYLGEGGMK